MRAVCAADDPAGQRHGDLGSREVRSPAPRARTRGQLAAAHDLVAALDRFRAIARDARGDVAQAARRICARAHDAALDHAAGAHERAAREVALLRQEIDRAVLAAAGPDPDGAAIAAVPAAVAAVRRQTRATAAVTVPLLVPVGPAGGACIVAGEEAIDDVIALAESVVVRAAASGLLGNEPVLVVNPRRRTLPAALAAIPGLTEARDARPALEATLATDADTDACARPPMHLVVLDLPHDLGMAGRRLVRAATDGAPGAPWPLLVHVSPDVPGIDLTRRLLRSASGPPLPSSDLELWPTRGGWRWRQHPGIVGSRGPTPSDDEWRAAVSVRSRDATAPHAVSPAARPALHAYGRLLDALADAARALDDELADVRARERTTLDGAARRRRQAIEAIAGEERTVALLERRAHRLLGTSSVGTLLDVDPPPDHPGPTTLSGDDGATPLPRRMAQLRQARGAVVDAVDALARALGT